MRYVAYLTRIKGRCHPIHLGTYSTRREAELAANRATTAPDCPIGWVGRTAIWGD